MKHSILTRMDDNKKIFCDNATKDLSKIKLLYYYFFIFATIYIEFGYRMVVSNTVSGTYRTLFLLLMCVSLIFSLRDFKFPLRPLALFAYLFAVIGLNMVFRDANKDNHILLLVAIFVGLVTAVSIEFKHLVHIFVNITTFLAVFSLVVFAVRVVAPELLNGFPVMWDPFNKTFAQVHDVGFAVVLMRSETIRNFGIAWEPGAFSILLCAALYCNFTFYKKFDVVKTIILTITIITTFSTMGYFVLAAIYFVSLKRSHKNLKGTIGFAVCAVLLVVVLCTLPSSLLDVVFSKLSGMFGSGVSETTQARIDAIKYPMRAFLDAPVLGVGYDKFALINKEQCNSVATNTIANWLACMGLAFGGPCIYCYLRFASKCVKFSRGGIIKFIFLAAAFVLMVSTESLLRISFIYTIIFFGCQKNLFEAKEEYIPQRIVSKKGHIQELSWTDSYHSEFGGEVPAFEIDDYTVQRNLARYRQNKVFADVVDNELASGKLLFILGMYHPRYSANGISCKKVIDECVSRGYDVSCVINDYAGEKKEDVIDGAKVYRIRHRLFDRVIQWCDRNTEKPYTEIIRKIAYVVNKLKFIIMSPTWPIVSPLYCYRFYKKAKKLVEKEKFDAVVSIYTPVDALLSGYFIKKKFPEIKYYPYFLDSLSGGFGPKQFSKERIINRGLRIEARVFEEADKIVLMKSSEEHQRKYNSRFSEKFIFLDIPMLSEPEEFKEKAKDDSAIKLLFVGSLSSNVRNPATLISALEKIPDENISCEFVGNVTCKEKFNKLKNLYGDRLIFTDFVNHDEISEKFMQADILINVGNLIPTMVPSKIFEYMSYGKPIISTFEIKNEPSKKYLEKYPLALMLNNKDSAEENAQKIQAFIKATEQKRVSFKDVEEVFELNTPKAFVDNVLLKG